MSSRSFFESKYAEFPNYYGLAVHDEFRKFVADEDARFRTFLDVGCGQGRHAIYAARAGGRVFAFDQSNQAIDQLNAYASSQNLKIEAVACCVQDCQFDSESFDDIIIVTCLDHLDLQQTNKLEPAIWTALKGNGRIYIEVFTVDDAGFKNNPEKSETSDVVRHYFEHGELLSIFKRWKIELYIEKVEEDRSHGPVHRHGLAVLIGRKVLGCV